MADMEKIKQLMEDGEKLGEVKKAVDKLSALLDKVVDAQQEVNKLIGRTAKVKTKTKRADTYAPDPKTAPYKLYTAMGAKPLSAEQVGKKVGIAPATCKVYFAKYGCFENVRGKGYICIKKKTTKKKGKKKS